MKVVAVIMAGGKGERFWPKSRRTMPKQFLSLTDDGKTMIQHTIERIKPLVAIEDVFVVTNKDYASLVKEQLTGLPQENILLEPAARNTAPCVGLAATYIRKKYKDAIMLVLPSDHLIKFNGIFINTLRDAIQVATEGQNMVTIGITPNYPETGYGYINFGEEKEGASNVYKVERFVEKPNLQLAKEYLDSGKYLWNSGMFVWKASTILMQFEKCLPDMYKGLIKIEETIGTNQEEEILTQEFINFKSESIDYGIMEKAKDIYTIPGGFGWDDVGSWLALERFNRSNEDGNVVSGNVISINTKNAIVQGSDKLIATIGVENLIIVDTEDAMLICAKDSTQDVKKVIENLKICNRNEYL
ncbi:mannose-1-phosphate guanylyltransferase [Cellulosilyticum sp. ST5]|uniref:mannose-1-phosphate guanylyltransferase n=1 Tax=unclassified Cellulosilyticum TaxID=2643091 RepID=UPI000F8DA777|nr:mannose-1-phosphate guanylyltransferase [Cellulosilyticum sp. WCF-2]QEH66983.1 NTP transferase domain-containing protein [Cellulosilyticum sp. WCF-2]